MSNSVDLLVANKALSFGNPLPTLDYATAVALGHVPGARPFRIIGTNTDIDNVREDIWELGGTYVFPPAGGIRMRVVSSSASDAVGSSKSSTPQPTQTRERESNAQNFTTVGLDVGRCCHRSGWLSGSGDRIS